MQFSDVFRHIQKTRGYIIVGADQFGNIGWFPEGEHWGFTILGKTTIEDWVEELKVVEHLADDTGICPEETLRHSYPWVLKVWVKFDGVEAPEASISDLPEFHNSELNKDRIYDDQTQEESCTLSKEPIIF